MKGQRDVNPLFNLVVLYLLQHIS